MKRLLLVILAGFLVVAMLAAVFLPSPRVVTDVAGGIAAKLACSGRNISGLSIDQVKEDLQGYSSLLGLVRINYEQYPATVTASFPTGEQHSASFRQGIGCALDVGDTTALEQISLPAIDPNTVNNSGQLDQLLTDQLASDNTAGLESRALLVMHHSKVIGEAYKDGFDQTTPLLGWSMGKSLISVLFGRLEQQGKLSTGETALFDDWNDDRQAISIADLLHMTSGLEFDETYLPGSDATYMLFNAHSAADVAMNQPAVHAPGTRFAYSSGTTNLLSKLLFQRTGGTTADAYAFLFSELLKPLGMAHTIVESDPSGVFVGSSYVFASARDWGKLGNLLANNGMHKGVRLLTDDWMQRALRPNGSDNEPRYGYQLWLNGGSGELRWPDLPADAYAMRGNRAQVVMVIPSRAAVFVRLGWSSGGYPTNKHFADWLTHLPKI